MDLVNEETQARSEALFTRIRAQRASLRSRDVIPFPVAIFRALVETLESEEARLKLKNDDCPVCLEDSAETPLLPSCPPGNSRL